MARLRADLALRTDAPPPPATVTDRVISLVSEGGPGRFRARFADFLPDTEAIAVRDHSPYLRLLIFAVVLFLVVGLTMAGMFKVEQVATAPGMVRPAGKVKIVNHPDGGRVLEIFVKDGDRVEEGQELLRLDPELVKQEVVKLDGLWHNLATEVVRLQAEISGAEPVFGDEFKGRPELVASQLALFKSRINEIAGRRAQADAVVVQQRSKIDSIKGKIVAAQKSIVILRDQEVRLRGLSKEGYFPEIRYQSILRQLIEEEGNLAAAREDLKTTEAALQEAQQRRLSVDSEWTSQLYKRQGDAIAERDRAKAALEQQDSMLRNLSLRAPTAGTVQGLRFSTVGQSIKPGDVVVTIVPNDDAVLVETRISNQDIGHIRLNQPAVVRMHTYDWVRYGTLNGVVESISADAVFDDKVNSAYFVVQVRTDRNYLGKDPGQYPVLPGMNATVDLHIGQRSILSYFLDRIIGSLDTAFRER